MAATGADPSDEAGAAALRPAFASLDLLVITLITPETEQVLPAAEMPGLRSEMNDALLELVYDDPLNAWEDIPVLELTGRSTAGWRGPRRAGPGPAWLPAGRTVTVARARVAGPVTTISAASGTVASGGVSRSQNACMPSFERVAVRLPSPRASFRWCP